MENNERPEKKRRGGRTAALPKNEVNHQPARTGMALQAVIATAMEASEITGGQLLDKASVDALLEDK